MRRDTDTRTIGQTEMTKIIVDFRNFANKPRYGVKEEGCSDHSALLYVIYVTQYIAPYIHPVYLKHTYAGNRPR
jgi:hypothetical protein